MSGDLRVTTTAKPTEGLATSKPTVAKSTLHQGFTYTILVDGERNSRALFDMVHRYVTTHLPIFDKGLKKLTAESTALSLRNTKYEQRTGDQAQILKELRVDLATYRAAQSTFHTNFQGLVIFAREVALYVKFLKPSQENPYMRAKPSDKEMGLVAQAKGLDKLKATAYATAKDGILVDVNSLKKNMFDKLGEFDGQMQKLEKRGSDMEAYQKSVISLEYWWTSPVKVEETGEEIGKEIGVDGGELDEAEYDKPESYSELLQGKGSFRETPELQLAFSSSASTSTTLSELQPASSSLASTSTTLSELQPVSSSLLSKSTPSLTSTPTAPTFQALSKSLSVSNAITATVSERDEETFKVLSGTATVLERDEETFKLLSGVFEGNSNSEPASARKRVAQKTPDSTSLTSTTSTRPPLPTPTSIHATLPKKPKNLEQISNKK